MRRPSALHKPRTPLEVMHTARQQHQSALSLCLSHTIDHSRHPPHHPSTSSQRLHRLSSVATQLGLWHPPHPARPALQPQEALRWFACCAPNVLFPSRCHFRTDPHLDGPTPPEPRLISSLRDPPPVLPTSSARALDPREHKQLPLWSLGIPLLHLRPHHRPHHPP